jgi:DNA-directed RNA polymerase specialized sigma24 family protein|tara:strand:- start:872 stop:1078 length:207 start_codon:yes stop_codon:yes gene_type:complete
VAELKDKLTLGKKKKEEELAEALLEDTEDTEELEDIPEELPEMIIDAFSRLPPDQMKEVIVRLWESKA